jgi:hypothetical protein|tara:strand:- start:56 stop:505 length:450 start_codon:yes stop_codon:yes gene_type:complete
MSLLGEELISIPLYYTYKDGKYGSKRLVILGDEQAKKLLESEEEETKDSVCILNTKWKSLSWKEQNELVKQSEKPNPTTGMPDLNWPVYQDVRVKTCLKSWDFKLNPNDPEPVKVSPDVIDKMNSQVIRALLDKFDTIVATDDMEDQDE